MRGKDIPLVTWYRSGRDKVETFKKPKYELKTAREMKAIQDKLGNTVGFYYGTLCKKCCGVYPAFFTEDSFNSLGYYVCLVCGKESTHEPMAWMARDSWNHKKYKWVPSQDGQLTIFDYMNRED